MRKTTCDICGKQLNPENNFGGYFEYRGPNTVTFQTKWDLCEEHGQEALRFIHSLKYGE